MGILEIAIAVKGKKRTIKYAFGRLGIGKMLNLKLDGKKGTISFEVELSGEASPISLEATYKITTKNGSAFIQLISLTINREWMNALAHVFLEKKGGTIPIPSGSEKYLKLLK